MWPGKFGMYNITTIPPPITYNTSEYTSHPAVYEQRIPTKWKTAKSLHSKLHTRQKHMQSYNSAML